MGLHAKLAEARSLFTRAEKDGNNPLLKNRYPTLGAMLTACKDVLAELKLVVIQRTGYDEKGERALLTKIVDAESGESEDLGSIPLLSMENRGVNAMQAYGSALTYARRYAYECGLELVRDDDDGNSSGGPRRSFRDERPDDGEDRRREINRDLQRPRPQPQPQQEDNRPKGVKLAEWCDRQGRMEQAQAMARSNFNAPSVADLDDAQADLLYKLLQATARPGAWKPQQNGHATPPAMPATRPVHQRQPQQDGEDLGWPRDGRSLFAWLKNAEQKFNVSLIRYVNDEVMRKRGWDCKIVECDPAQTQAVAVAVATKLREDDSYNGEFERHIPAPFDPSDLQDEIASTATDLFAALGNNGPSKDDISKLAASHAQAIVESGRCPAAGGEVFADLWTCENEALLQAVLESIRADVADGAAA